MPGRRSEEQAKHSSGDERYLLQSKRSRTITACERCFPTCWHSSGPVSLVLRPLIPRVVKSPFEIFIGLFHLGVIALAWWGHFDAFSPACGWQHVCVAQELIWSSMLSNNAGSSMLSNHAALIDVIRWRRCDIPDRSGSTLFSSHGLADVDTWHGPWLYASAVGPFIMTFLYASRGALQLAAWRAVRSRATTAFDCTLPSQKKNTESSSSYQ